MEHYFDVVNKVSKLIKTKETYDTIKELIEQYGSEATLNECRELLWNKQIELRDSVINHLK